MLDTAAENRVQDAPSEESQRPHTAGSQQTGQNIQVNLLSLEICGKTQTSKALHLIVPSVGTFKIPTHLFLIGFFSWGYDADYYSAVFFSLDISNSPNY